MVAKLSGEVKAVWCTFLAFKTTNGLTTVAVMKSISILSALTDKTNKIAHS